VSNPMSLSSNTRPARPPLSLALTLIHSAGLCHHPTYFGPDFESIKIATREAHDEAKCRLDHGAQFVRDVVQRSSVPNCSQFSGALEPEAHEHRARIDLESTVAVLEAPCNYRAVKGPSRQGGRRVAIWKEAWKGLCKMGCSHGIFD
jgi:hypothetical protein